MTASRSGSERLKVGIIGGGAITQVAHLPVLKKLKTIEVQAICDTDLPKARALADRFAVKDAFDDIEDLLRFESLDAVVICSPNHLHESHILAALSANLHVLVEKPLAMSAASAAAHHPRGGEARPGGDGRDEPPLPARRADRPQLRPERRAGHHRERARELARVPAQPRAARLAAEAGPGGRRRDARSRPLHSRPRPLAGRQPRADPGERQPGRDRQGPRGRAVGQRVRGLRERHVALRGRDLAPSRRGRAVRRRPPGQQGQRRDQPAHGLEGAERRAGGRLAHRVGQPGECLHRLLPGGVGPLRGRARRRGQGAHRCRTTWCCTRWWTRSTARPRTGETWSCEAGRLAAAGAGSGDLLLA